MCVILLSPYSIKITMNCIENKRNSPHILDVPECKRMKKMDCASKQHFINYVSVPSLERIAILKIATGLWKQSDITDAVQRQSGSSLPLESDDDVSEEISELKKNACENLSLLPLPNLLKEEVAKIIAPLLFQIFEWMYYEYPRCLERNEIPPVYWTIEGTIDKVKTLRQLTRSDIIFDNHICRFFKVACKYCLEDSILYLWNELLKAVHLQKYYIKDFIDDMMEEADTYDDHFGIYWVSILKNKFSEINRKIQLADYDGIYNSDDSVYKNMFTLAIKTGNIEAVKHFFKKFTSEEKSCSLVQWIKDAVFHLKENLSDEECINKYSDVLYFLLSQMADAEQQREVFVENSAVILSSLFEHWSLQKFLLPTIRTIWSSLDEKVYVEFLKEVSCKIAVNPTAHKLLRKLWLESPKDLKKYFIKCSTAYFPENCINVICQLLKAKDVETIKSILTFADVDKKEKIFLSFAESDTFLFMLCHDDLLVFDTLISETLPPVQALKAKVIQKHGNDWFCRWIYNHNFNRQKIEKFFKWAFSSQDQIDEFKTQVLKTSSMSCALTKCLHKYDLEETFMKWCNINEEKLGKKADVEQVLELGLFEDFVDWYFVSEKNVDDRVVAFFDFLKEKVI